MLVKKIAHKVLGTERYLVTTSKAFFLLYRSGFLGFFRQFDCHYFVRQLLKPGDHVIDIGANIGYYTVIFAHLAGRNGLIHAVEPIGLFRKILSRNTKNYRNILVYPYSLGENPGKKIRMGIPSGEKHFRHGLMRVIPTGKEKDYDHVSESEMRRAQDLFGQIERCDYIKCDVEGYEMHVLPGMYFLFEKFRPILQVETSHQNKNEIMELLGNLDYRAYSLRKRTLTDISGKDARVSGDVFFIPRARAISET